LVSDGVDSADRQLVLHVDSDIEAGMDRGDVGGSTSVSASTTSRRPL